MSITQPITRPIATPIARGVAGASLGGGGDPLLAAMLAESPIIAYDNNDLSTFFADHTGTTPASINGVCGLQLDKSEGLVLGPELVADPGFDSPAAWTPENAAWVVSGGKATYTAPGANVTYLQANSGFTLTGGRWYEARFMVSGLASGSMVYSLFNSTASVNLLGAYQVLNSNGEQVIRFLVASTTTGVRIYGNNSGTSASWSLESFSIRELPGYHRYQANLANRPVLRGTPTGANLFSAYSAPDAGWVDSGSGVATATATTGNISTNIAPTARRVYRVRYTCTVTSGSVRFVMGGVNGVTRTASGTYEEHITASSTAVLKFDGVTSFTGTVSAVDIRDASADAVSAPYFLHFDGVDDFMQTASVNLTGTDEVTVCTGVRKLSDMAIANLLEFSATTSTNNGAFTLFSPIDANQANFAAYTRGTVTFSGGTLVSAPALSPKVLCAAFDNSQATVAQQVVLRINGAAGTLLAPVGPTTAGNFGNYPFYFGRRGGTTLPFNGYDYGPLIFPAVKSGAGLAAIEAFSADRTGVTL